MPITPEEVAKYYLYAELCKILIEEKSKDEFKRLINTLTQQELFSLLEIISKKYRNNAIYDLVVDSNIYWKKEIISMTQIKLSGVNSKINPYLESVQYLLPDFIKLIERDSQKDDLREFQIKPIHQDFKTLIMKHENSYYYVVDGIHRCVSMARQGITEHDAYIAYRKQA